jgi:hypothetical protein
MSRVHQCVLCVGLTVASFASSIVQAQTRHALVIGVDTYHYGDAVTRSWRAKVSGEALASRTATARRGDMPDLEGAVNDAREIGQVLRGKYKFESIDTLYNQQATRDGILAAIGRLIAQSRPGDIVVFYYAGHGSQRYNSLAPQSVSLNRLDQTIVPADANIGQFDIRNTELTDLFNQLLAKDVQLTLIFDSCNSGSAVRGLDPPRVRFAPYDPRDARDPSDPESLTKPGRHNPALFIAAAQENQSAVEERATGHGAFTAALLNVMRSSATSLNTPAQQVFRQVEAALRWNPLPQVPVLKGTEAESSRPLFGRFTGPAASSMVVALQGVRGDTAILDGGAALGVGPGTELHSLADSAKVRLRVVSTELGTSRAVAVVGKLAATPGAAFVIDKWVLPTAAKMRVWIPKSVPASQLASAVASLSELRRGTVADWVADPVALPDDSRPLYTILYDNGWKLRNPSGRDVALSKPSAADAGAAITADQRRVADSLSATAAKPGASSGSAGLGRPRLFVMLPPSDMLAKTLGIGSEPTADIQASARADSARYALVGRIDSSGVSYAWVLPNASQSLMLRTPFPVRTEWFSAGNVATAGADLADWGRRLARINYWETVQPHNPNPFPYHLAMRRVGSSASTDKTVGDTTPNLGGESYQIVLRKNPGVQGPVRQQWVYIFTLDRTGAGRLLFGRSMNFLPALDSTGRRTAPDEIVIPTAPSPITICPAYGTDTFAMVASAGDIGTPAVTFAFPEILRDRASRSVGGENGADPVPEDWSIERLWLRSMAPPASAGDLIANGIAKCRVTRDQLLDPGGRLTGVSLP